MGLITALNSQAGDVVVNDNLNDPFQPDVRYRGFEASPVLGTPQGLAVYQNGVRINEAFGDTVNWDLIPDIAIRRADLVSSNPVYGLNALGGAIAISMKNGFTDPGGDAEVSAGSFGLRTVSLQYGARSSTFGLYAAGRVLNEDGWRMFSGDSLKELYLVGSLRADRAALDLSYQFADNDLHGEGATPVQELALGRSLVFTGPQENLNRLNFLTLKGSLTLTRGWSVQGVTYYRHFRQGIANGNGASYLPCVAPHAGSLCEPDGVTPLSDTASTLVPDISRGGTIPVGANDLEAIEATGSGVALQSTLNGAVLGRRNQITLGATFDASHVDFNSATQVGRINPQLTVLPSTLLVDTPESSFAGAEFGATPIALAARSRVAAAYLTDTYEVTSALTVTGSGRYNVVHIRLQDQLGSNLSGESRYSHFNPALGATYRFLPRLTGYAGVAANTRSPTVSEIECSSPARPCVLPSSLAGDPPTLRQVIAHTTEAGLRGRAGSGTSNDTGALAWHAGVFRTHLHDDIYPVATSVSSGYFRNIDATRLQGVETGLNYSGERWSVYANYSYLEAEFESALSMPSPANPFRDASGNIQVRPGNRLPGVPRHQLKLGADYQLSSRGSIGAALNLSSSQYYFGDSSNQNAPLPGYCVIDLHLSLRVGRQAEAFLTVSNVLDRRYSTYGLLGDPSGVGARGVPAQGEASQGGVDARFQSPAAPRALLAGIKISL
jgi:iron complex outermembrane receptor protein